MWDLEDFYCYFIDDPLRSSNEDYSTSPIVTCNFTQVLDSDLDKLSNLANLNLNEIMNLASAALLEFIQVNFTGPGPLNVFQSSDLDTEETHLKSLSIDGEEVDPNTKHSKLLMTAQNLLMYARNKFPGTYSVQLWYLRYLLVHQKIIEEPCTSLFEKFTITATFLLDNLITLTSLKNRALVKLEILQGFLQYKRVSQAEKLFEEVKEMLKVEIEKSGALGVRTKYQTKPVPQLLVRVNQQDEQDEGSVETQIESASVTHTSTNLPKLLLLEDDLRLEAVKFNDETEGKLQQYNSVIQALLLAHLRLTELSQAQDSLFQEVMAPILVTLLNQEHGPWLVRINALLTNIKLESNHKRTIERSLKQAEELVNVIKSGKTPATLRFSYIFATNYQPLWHSEIVLADMMIRLGMVKTALDIFIRLQRWDAVIECYTVLELRHKAAEIIQREIEKKPTVQLYCLLGDATDDVSCYETAWKMSGEKSGKAQRHWGNFYFAKKQYEEAIPHLELTLQLNSLQEIQWLRLGYAALSLERWDVAANAYRRYTMIEPNGFESWNNLAKAYIKLNDKPRAHKVLHESLKCNFNNWKVWENFLLVSIDVGSFEDAINAYNRLFELKDNKYYDKEVLEIVYRAVKEDKPDCNGVGAGRLKNKFVTLLGRQLAQNPTLALVWELSANLTDEPLSRGQKFLKANRAYTGSRNDWGYDNELCAKIVQLTVQTAESTLEAAELEATDKVSVMSQLSSARLLMQGVMKVVKQANEEKFHADLELLQELLAKITEHMQKLK